MGGKQFSTGEAAKISGLTIRTLQHYDNIGVLPASGRTEGGRRFYTESDMLKLEHVVFYRSLGLSLEQIKGRLLGREWDESENNLLNTQKFILYNQIYAIQNSIAAIEGCQEIIDAGKTPPWSLLATFMQSLSAVDVAEWGEYEFSDEQTQVFKEHLPSLDDVMDFYNTWKRLSIKAAAFHAAGVQPDESISETLARDWLDMADKATGGKEDHMDAYLKVDEQRDTWNPAERELIEKAEPFLNEAIRVYRQKNQGLFCEK